MIRELLDAVPYLALIGVGAGLIAAVRHDPPAANVHDVADYRPDPAEPTRLVDGHRRRLATAPAALTALDAPLDTLPGQPGAPLYAAVVVAELVRRYGDSPADIAARWLREAAERDRLAVTR